MGLRRRNNVYLFGHAHSVFKPLHDAYVRGRLAKGMRVSTRTARAGVDLRRVVVEGHGPRQGGLGVRGPVDAEPHAADVRRRQERVRLVVRLKRVD